MKILAIDPGPEQSAFVLWDGRVEQAGMLSNDAMSRTVYCYASRGDVVAIEMVACYGMPVGAETFETCVWIGRFTERAAAKVAYVYRKDVKLHLCQSMRAKDANIRQALIDKHGPVGTKKNPGPLYGVSGHLWAALAVADYAADNLKQ
jgi:hypothetical protein